MPRAFNASESAAIRDSLRATARERFGRSGIGKSSIDDIVGPANIAKGSFYKFYPSKEALFFELLEEAQDSVRAPMLPDVVQRSRTRSRFIKCVVESISRIRSEPLLRVLGSSSELQGLARRLPVETLSSHQKRDSEFLEQLISHWHNKRTRPATDKVGSHMALIMLIQQNETLLGERLYPYAEQTIVQSFADCFF